MGMEREQQERRRRKNAEKGGQDIVWEWKESHETGRGERN